MSQTGSIISRLIKLYTGAEYNHASVCLSMNLERMYSFGRRQAYNPFWGGFVIESREFGAFKRFSNSKIKVLEVPVSNEKYEEVEHILEEMWRERKEYHYNYLGLFLAAFGIKRMKKNCYYCSEFVGEILLSGHVEGSEELNPIIQPIHFLNIPHNEIFCGRLSDYNISKCR